MVRTPVVQAFRDRCRLLAATAALAAAVTATPSASAAPEPPFPASSAVIDVTQPPYNARGDGRADDTEALQKALSDVMGRHMIVYFPPGTYLVSRPLRWSKKNSAGGDAWGFNTLQGAGAGRSVIRLRDATFTDPARPEPIMWCGGFGSADWFHNFIKNLTFDVGRGNPGAIGLQFYSNNIGALRDLEVVSGDGQGFIGLDLAHADMNGPLLVRRVAVRGFSVGIKTGATVNSQTFEHISLSGQSGVGMLNEGQCISIRGLRSQNAVTALRALSPTVLLDAELEGPAGPGGPPAVEIGSAPFYARNVVTKGYNATIGGEGGKVLARGPQVPEYLQGRPTSPFPTRSLSLGLEVRETPETPLDDPKSWAIVNAFGADPTGGRDSSEAIQKAIDSGATTVFFPGAYALTSPVRVRGKVRRLLGVGNWIDYNHVIKPDLIIEDGEAATVFIEHFAPINGGIEVDTTRTVVLRSVETRALVSKRAADLFLEDFGTGGLRLIPGQKVWARQLNMENEGEHLVNDGATLWVLGYKTERGGTLLTTRGGGRTELFGNFSYTTTAGKLAPMFVTENASVFAFFHEVCYSGDPFATLIRETRGKATRVVARGEGGTAPYVTVQPGK